MARYLLSSFTKDGPYFGAIFHDGDTLRFWGAYRTQWCMADRKTPLPRVRTDIVERGAPLQMYACAPLYRSFAVLEGSNKAKASVEQRLDGLTYDGPPAS